MVLATFLSLALATRSAFSSPLTKRGTTPSVASASSVGIATDVYLNRDSCTSVHVDTREFWTCRDTQTSGGAFLSSTASWSDFASDGTPNIPFGVLSLYGDNPAEYFGVPSDECGGTAGGCSDGTRWAIWPDSPPLPVQNSDGSYSLYTWIRNSHIRNDLSLVNAGQQTTSLYRGTYSPSSGTTSSLPPDSLLSETFWPAGAIPYGSYGWVISSDTAYLYGALDNNSGQSLAKVPLSSIENPSAYSFYNPQTSSWQASPPQNNDSSFTIPNAGTGQQGTFYYSDYFQSYLWIGSPYIGDNAVFMLSTAPAPEGPWTSPVQIYEGERGNSTGLSAYSQQAHPGLSEQGGNGKDIWLSYTKVDNQDTYTTELIRVIWN